jgi:hypothetical protein
MNTCYFKSSWLQNLIWALAPGFLDRVFRTTSTNGCGVRDIEASVPSDLSRPTPTSQQLTGQEAQVDEETNANTKTRQKHDKNQKVFICLIDKRPSSWRLSHAKVQRTCENEAPALYEGQRQAGEDENNTNDGMDKSLFLALRQKLLCRQTLDTWRWFTPNFFYLELSSGR